MGNLEAYSHFVVGLNPDVRMQIGVHTQHNYLEVAIAMAEKIDCYQRVEAGKMVQGETSSFGATEKPQKGGKKGKGFRKPRNQKCMACQKEGHWIQDCPYMAKLLKTVRDDKKPSKN